MAQEADHYQIHRRRNVDPERSNMDPADTTGLYTELVFGLGLDLCCCSTGLQGKHTTGRLVSLRYAGLLAFLELCLDAR